MISRGLPAEHQRFELEAHRMPGQKAARGWQNRIAGGFENLPS